MISARDQQIQALYRAALERPLAERASFVTQLAGDDQELRRSVELLLSSAGDTDVGARIAAPPELAIELPIGTSVGHYRIDGVLGRGGMGVVYRATDTKLRRPVAIKFLSSTVADAEVRRRFKQEAETTSALNHPHIVTVYDVGEHDGQQYIVSELVDGGTLDDWSTAGRKRSWRHGVELAAGIADGLAAAHAAGVLHRDVKPSNILLGSNGYAKLADFGLAKLVATGAQEPAASRNTRAGIVVGTIAYMSPEQAAGQPLDARSDVFSFGIVLYELIAGRKPFEGANELEVLKAIAHATPAPLPGDLPELLRIAVDKALEKDPAERYQSMRELVVDLKRVLQRRAVEAPAHTRPSARPLAALGVALAGALAAAAVLAALYFGQAPPVAEPIRFRVPTPGLELQGATAVSVSPDGRRIAYLVFDGNTRRLWVRSLDAFDARPLTGTDNVTVPFWSPDSRSIAFFADGKLKKVAPDGGPVQTLGDAFIDAGGSWSERGEILLASTEAAGGAGVAAIGRMAADGGPVTAVTRVDAAEGGTIHFFPQFLPDGRRFLYVSAGPLSTGPELFLGSLTDGAPKRLMTLGTIPGSPPQFAYASGYLLFVRDTTLFAQPFDLDAEAFSGEPVPIASPARQFAASANGVLVYHEPDPTAAPASSSEISELRWFGRDGAPLGTLGPPGTYQNPAISPDGTRVAVDRDDGGNRDIWTIDVVRGVPLRLTFDAADDMVPIWSPDGRDILFASARDGARGPLTGSLYRRAASGAGSDELVYSAANADVIASSDWTDAGVLFARVPIAQLSTGGDLWLLPSAGERTPEAVLATPARKGAARVSPDGRWVAYSSNESGTYEIFVQPFPDLSRGKWQVSTGGAIEAKWRADGGELFYLASDGNLVAVDVKPGETFAFGEPRVLFHTGLPIPNFPLMYNFDVAPDGERFLINVPQQSASSPTTAESAARMLNVVVNWTTPLNPAR